MSGPLGGLRSATHGAIFLAGRGRRCLIGAGSRRLEGRGPGGARRADLWAGSRPRAAHRVFRGQATVFIASDPTGGRRGFKGPAISVLKGLHRRGGSFVNGAPGSALASDSGARHLPPAPSRRLSAAAYFIKGRTIGPLITAGPPDAGPGPRGPASTAHATARPSLGPRGRAPRRTPARA